MLTLLNTCVMTQMPLSTRRVQWALRGAERRVSHQIIIQKAEKSKQDAITDPGLMEAALWKLNRGGFLLCDHKTQTQFPFAGDQRCFRWRWLTSKSGSQNIWSQNYESEQCKRVAQHFLQYFLFQERTWNINVGQTFNFQNSYNMISIDFYKPDRQYIQ